MKIVTDTSAVIAVIFNEPHRQSLIEITRGADLLAPSSLPAEIGNALSAMFKRKRIVLEQALSAVLAYQEIAIRLSEIDLEWALQLADELDIYAYDAFFIDCALKHRSPLISLDKGLLNAAQNAGVQIIEVKP